jgi:GH43 family beta-xylosidase
MGGKTYLAFSASYCWGPAYCLGLLTWNGGNPVQASSWAKSGGCVFSSANGHYGTGHNSFFQGKTNGQWYNVFHATSVPGGACDDSRYTMVQPVNTNSNGSPNFGIPAPFSQAFPEPA